MVENIDIFSPCWITFAICTAATIIALYGIGAIMYKFTLSNSAQDSTPTTKVFGCLMCGLCTIVPFFAIAHTTGNSIMWLCIVIWLCFILRKRKDTKLLRVYDKSDIKPLSIIVSISIVASFASYWLFIIRSGGQFFCDQIFYGNLSVWIKNMNCENAAFLTEYKGAAMYHWGDMWLTAAISYFSGLKSIYCLCLSTYTITATLTITGAFASILSISKCAHTRYLIIPAVSFIFIFPVMSIIGWGGAILSNPKDWLIAALLLWSLNGLVRKDNFTATIAALMAVPLYSPIAPGILTFVFIYNILANCNRCFTWKSIFNFNSMLAVVCAVFFCLFYYVQPANISSEGGFASLNSGSVAVNAALFTIKRFVRYCLMLVPSLIILFASYKLCKKKLNFNGLVRMPAVPALIISLAAACATGGVCKQYLLDGGQITTNYCESVVLLAIFTTLIVAISQLCINDKCKTLVLAIIGLVYIVIGISKIDRMQVYPISTTTDEEAKFYTKLQTIFNTNDQRPSIATNIAYFRNYELEENHNTQKTRSNMFFPIDKMVHILPDGFYYPVCLSAMDKPQDTQLIWDDTKRSLLYKYYLKHKGLPHEELIKSYLQEKEVQHIICEQGFSLPEYLIPLCKKIADYNGNIVYSIDTKLQ